MTHWSSTYARRVLAARLRIGWIIKRQTGSHRTLSRPGWLDFVFAFHDQDELGLRMFPNRKADRPQPSAQKTCRSYLRLSAIGVSH